MRKMIFAYYVMVVLLFSTTAVLTAETFKDDVGSMYVIGEEDNKTTNESGRYEDDFFFGGDELNFSGLADDLYLMGRTIDFSGTSDGALTAFGENIDISGLVSRNLHTAGQYVNITGTIDSTAFVAGQDVTIAESAVIDGTLLSGSNTLTIKGALNNGLLAGAGEIIIDGPVKGDINVRTGKLIITERGYVDGNVIYGANSKLSEAEKARVSGTVTFEEMKDYDTEGWSTFCIIMGILGFAGVLAAGLLMLLLPAVRNGVAAEREPKSYGKTLLWGLIPLFIYPVLVVVTIPLFPISVALLLAAAPLLLVTLILGLTLSGQLLFKAFRWERNNRFLHFLLAFGIYVLLSQVPVLDFLLGLGLTALGAGFLISKLFSTEFK